ncbi:hypothetical protein CMMCAS05_13715 [Clavibacter michiganensis subsp. michiganensis]|nr:hypothetical protein CMMCAS05_13715 [Clavibacter michiganensis subsp. michiganensis]
MLPAPRLGAPAVDDDLAGTGQVGGLDERGHRAAEQAERVHGEVRDGQRGAEGAAAPDARPGGRTEEGGRGREPGGVVVSRARHARTLRRRAGADQPPNGRSDTDSSVPSRVWSTTRRTARATDAGSR